MENRIHVVILRREAKSIDSEETNKAWLLKLMFEELSAFSYQSSL